MPGTTICGRTRVIGGTVGPVASILEAAVADDHPKVHHLEVLDLILDLYEIIDESDTIEGIDYDLCLPQDRGADPILVISDVDRDTRRFRLVLAEDIPVVPNQDRGGLRAVPHTREP